MWSRTGRGSVFAAPPARRRSLVVADEASLAVTRHAARIVVAIFVVGLTLTAILSARVVGPLTGALLIAPIVRLGLLLRPL